MASSRRFGNETFRQPVTGCAEESARPQPVGSRLPEGLVSKPSGRSHGLYLRLGDASASHDGSGRTTRRRRAGKSRRLRVELTRAPRLYCARCFLFFIFNYYIVFFFRFMYFIVYTVHAICLFLLPLSSTITNL